MFATLSIKKSPETFKEYIKEIFSSKAPQQEMIRLKNGSFFFNITVSAKKGRINWKDLELSLGNYYDKILLPDFLTLEANSCIKKPALKKIIPKAVFNTALKLFSVSETSFDEIAVIDKNAELKNEIIRLVPFCKTLCVVTDKPSAFFEISDKILDEYGAAILISDTPVLKGEKCFVIAPFGVYSYNLPNTVTVITGHTIKNIPQPKHLQCATLNLEDDYLKFLPKDIPLNDFASALYEFAAVKDENNTRYKTIINCSRELTLEQIVL
ncbi:MAG: hypothetical protein K5917_07885 [Clostridiales bacterium]|nr:hypothetical protein [Clostridiales bacterium]